MNSLLLNVPMCRFCTFGIFSLVLCWVAAGTHLGISLVSISPTWATDFKRLGYFLLLPICQVLDKKLY